MAVKIRPLVIAVVRWVPVERGGRKSGPPTVDVYAATAVLVMEGPKVVPNAEIAQVLPG